MARMRFSRGLKVKTTYLSKEERAEDLAERARAKGYSASVRKSKSPNPHKKFAVDVSK